MRLLPIGVRSSQACRGRSGPLPLDCRRRSKLYGAHSQARPRSSSGLGHQPLTLGTGVQIPYGAPNKSEYSFFFSIIWVRLRLDPSDYPNSDSSEPLRRSIHDLAHSLVDDDGPEGFEPEHLDQQRKPELRAAETDQPPSVPTAPAMPADNGERRVSVISVSLGSA